MRERTIQIGIRIPHELLARVEEARVLGGAEGARSRTDALLAVLKRGLAAIEADREPSAELAAMRAAVRAECTDPELLAMLERDDEGYVRGAFAVLVSQRAGRADREAAEPLATVTPIRPPNERTHTTID